MSDNLPAHPCSGLSGLPTRRLPSPEPMGRKRMFLACAAALAASLVMLSGCDSPNEPATTELPIVYVRFPENNVSRSDLYLLSADGRRTEQLTRLTGAVNSPSWSPDGRRIVFERIVYSETGGSPETGLYTVGLSGADTVRLAPALASAGAPSWSPDGQRIAVRYRDDSSAWGIALINADGSGAVRVAGTEGAQERPGWTPDGARILFSRAGSIWSVPAQGGDAKQLTERSCGQGGPRVAPDGRQFAYLGSACDFSTGQLVVASMDGTGSRTVTEGDIWAFTWAADGQSIIFSMLEDQQIDLFTVSVNSSAVTRLTRTTPELELDPDWR